MNNIRGKEKQSNKYRRKYKYMKKIIKSLIIENAALCDEVAKIQESILIVKDERKFLFRKLTEHEIYTENVTSRNSSSNAHNIQNGTGGKTKKRRSPDAGAKSFSIT